MDRSLAERRAAYGFPSVSFKSRETVLERVPKPESLDPLFPLRVSRTRRADSPGPASGARDRHSEMPNSESARADRRPRNTSWGNTNRVVSNRVVSKGPLYPSKTKILCFLIRPRLCASEPLCAQSSQQESARLE